LVQEGFSPVDDTPPVDMSTATLSPPARARRSTAAAILFGVAAGVIVHEPWHGPIVLSLSSARGVSAGDLLAVPLVVLAVRIARAGRPRHRRASSPRRRPADRRAGPAAAVALGALLVVVAVVHLRDRGPLVPAGGGTFDGTVHHVAGRAPSPVGEWSHVALAYEGSSLRLFVNGTEVSSRATAGTVPASTSPLWIGGNRPFGEHFAGDIDEVRVYDRALGGAAIRADMATPLALDTPRTAESGALATTARPPAGGPVAAYALDTGSGTSVVDLSGNGNDGRIIGATWTADGRYGNALRFDGDGDAVRVPASASLDVGEALTLSAWIRPTEAQDGWRTVVHRATDTWFLTASSTLGGLAGPVDDVLAGSVVAAAAWLSVVTVRGRGRWLGERRRAWPVGVGVVLAGCVADAVSAPAGTLFGPTLLAGWFAATARNRVEAVSGWLVSAALVGATVASLVDLGGIGAWTQRADGGLSRTAALGVAVIVIGLVRGRDASRGSGRDASTGGRSQVQQGLSAASARLQGGAPDSSGRSGSEPLRQVPGRATMVRPARDERRRQGRHQVIARPARRRVPA
jgi:hypothetical protein